MGWLFLIFVIFVIFVGLALKGDEMNEKIRVDKRTKIQNDLNAKDFFITRYFLSDETGNGIYYDDKNNKIAIVNLTNKFDPTQFDYKYSILNTTEILESEIIQDGVSITKTSRGGQLAGAIVGGVLAGGAGAIIGGVTSSKSTSEKINKLILRVTVNNTSQPIHDVVFANYTSPKSNDDILVKKVVEQLDHFHKVISILIKQNDNQKKNEQTSNSTADELMKLAELKRDGILTDEEFNQQKQKLLSS